VLLMGHPGAGKTILAQQFLFENATPARPGVYMSTVAEPIEKILRFAQSLEFFDPEAVGDAVFYQSLGEVLSTEGLAGMMKKIEAVLKERKPSVLVIDSFKAIHDFEGMNGDLRALLHNLASTLSAFPVTTLLLGEYGTEDIARLPEFAIADAIVSLGVERTSQREKRVIQIAKLRGSDFKTGRHAYRIGSSGLEVFPRLADPIDIHAYALPTDRIESGIEGLDGMMGGGLLKGSSTLVIGPAGSGKTLFGLHHIFSASRRGENGLIATFQENPVQLERFCAGFGWTLADPKVSLLYRTPVDLHIDEWVYQLLEVADTSNIACVLIDSLGDLHAAAGDEVRFREYIYSLLQRLSRAGISCVMTQESSQLEAAFPLAGGSISHLSDNVVLFGYVPDDRTIKRHLTILKTRGSDHDHSVREYTIGPQGISFAARSDLGAANPKPG
jgi:circadian clock protein KaiC